MFEISHVTFTFSVEQRKDLPPAKLDSLVDLRCTLAKEWSAKDMKKLSDLLMVSHLVYSLPCMILIRMLLRMHFQETFLVLGHASKAFKE